MKIKENIKETNKFIQDVQKGMLKASLAGTLTLSLIIFFVEVMDKSKSVEVVTGNEDMISPMLAVPLLLIGLLIAGFVFFCFFLFPGVLILRTLKLNRFHYYLIMGTICGFSIGLILGGRNGNRLETVGAGVIFAIVEFLTYWYTAIRNPKNNVAQVVNDGKST